MTWNYRVIEWVETASNETRCFAIHEVFYDAAGRLKSFSKTPLVVTTPEPGEDYRDLLRAELNLMAKAIDDPVLSDVDVKPEASNLQPKASSLPKGGPPMA